MRRTILHPRTLQPFAPIGLRKDGRPIFPILGGSEPPNQPSNPPSNPPSPTDPPNPPGHPAPTDPPAATTDPADPNFFPPNTAVDDMTDKQKAAYWRNQSKIQQARVPKNLEELQAAAAKWAEVERERMTPSEKALAEAREAGKAEGALAANQEAASSILNTSLGLRGKSDAEIAAIMRGINPAGFIKDGKVDNGAIAQFIDTIAPAAGSGGQGPGGGRGIGQGRYDAPPADRRAAGMAEAERRGFIKKTPAGA